MSIEFSDINYLAVLVGVVINMFAGAMWYSPILFAKPWMAKTGISLEYIQEHEQQAYKGYAVSIVASIMITLTLAILVQLAGATTAADGLTLGLLAGIGFILTTQAANYTFESRPIKLYLINAGYPAVTFVVIGILLALWD